MKTATLALIIRKNEILLGRKQGSPEIGEGTLNGPGGKQEPGESILECLVRETKEEVGILLDPTKVEKCAVITFYVGETPDFKVHVYRADTFSGEPIETESMVPAWYDITDIPFERMLESDRAWFPKLVQGATFDAEVYYRERAKDFLSIKFHPFTGE